MLYKAHVSEILV